MRSVPAIFSPDNNLVHHCEEGREGGYYKVPFFHAFTGRVPDRLGSGVRPHADAVPNRITLTFSSLHNYEPFLWFQNLQCVFRLCQSPLLFSWLGQKFLFFSLTRIWSCLSVFSQLLSDHLFVCISSAVDSRIPQPWIISKRVWQWMYTEKLWWCFSTQVGI